jgi:hypothetical protein
MTPNDMPAAQMKEPLDELEKDLIPARRTVIVCPLTRGRREFAVSCVRPPECREAFPGRLQAPR